MINMKGVALALVIGVLAFGSYIIYEKGYEDAVKDRRIEELEIVKKTQLEVKEKYEKEIKDLITAHERERAGYIDRMHELKKFESTGRDLATCSRERSKLARLAIRGEKLLKRADSYLEALK